MARQSPLGSPLHLTRVNYRDHSQRLVRSGSVSRFPGRGFPLVAALRFPLCGVSSRSWCDALRFVVSRCLLAPRVTPAALGLLPCFRASRAFPAFGVVSFDLALLACHNCSCVGATAGSKEWTFGSIRPWGCRAVRRRRYAAAWRAIADAHPGFKRDGEGVPDTYAARREDGVTVRRDLEPTGTPCRPACLTHSGNGCSCIPSGVVARSRRSAALEVDSSHGPFAVASAR